MENRKMSEVGEVDCASGNQPIGRASRKPRHASPTSAEETHENAIALVSTDTSDLMRQAYSENTLVCRKSILNRFDEWLQGREITDAILTEYLSHLFLQGKAPSTIASALSAVKWFLRLNNKGVDLPFSTATLSGISRAGRDRGRGQRKGITWRDVEKICAIQEADGTLLGLRNSAIIQVMSDGLLRVSEVTELRISDLEENMMKIRFSKTDQEGKGAYLYLCDATRCVIKKWIERAGITEGYLFRRMTARGDKIKNPDNVRPMSTQAIRSMIQKSAKRIGLTEGISTHSLRVGSAISLAQAGATLVEMQIAGRWKNPAMPAHYARAQLSSKGAIARYKDGK